MGFLRKVGRKVSKKLKKVFGTKLGSIVGMVGLYFMMGAVAKQLTGWAQSTFGTATTAASQGAQAAELGASVAAESGALAEAAMTAKTGAKATQMAVTASGESLAALQSGSAFTAGTAGASSANMTNALNTTVSAGSGTVNNLNTMLSTAPTNADKLNVFMGAQESAVQAGTSASTLSTTLTEAVSTAANDPTLLSQTTAEVTANLSAQPIDFTDADFRQIYEGSNVTAKEGSQFSKAVTDTDLQTRTLMPKDGVTLDKFNADPSRFGTLGPDATGFDQIKRFASDPIGVTRGAIQNTAASAIDYATGPDFIPDTLQAGATGYVNNALAEEQTGQRMGGQVMGQPINEIAQNAYMQSVGPQLQNSGLAGVRTFADLSNQTLYGTGTPDYLRSLYQPLPMPSPLQLG